MVSPIEVYCKVEGSGEEETEKNKKKVEKYLTIQTC